ncbi:TetR/AcrR family transcriptional regulator [Microbacterium murale]|uniref:HTH tetR-type domain-containing protein n=1 Tax=Microbacterium murale TaxID=1081040 RepID=A0ABQ1RFX3_9MICO|nr:TetR/AcrR family transcriptional regulator [Microbacterium murale]GGD65732.1 hypothetical protein GCM10007269_06220 [Microbacterium murale]
MRPPRQQRSRQTWQSIVDAALIVLEREGLGGFTIAAVCAEADVAPTAIYARVSSKDELFAAVYESGNQALADDGLIFLDDERWESLTLDDAVDRAVEELMAIVSRRAGFLRAVVKIGGDDLDARRTGSERVAQLGEQFCHAILCGRTDGEVLATRAAAAFRLVYSALFFDAIHGEDFGAVVRVDDAERHAGLRAAAHALLAVP